MNYDSLVAALKVGEAVYQRDNMVTDQYQRSLDLFVNDYPMHLQHEGFRHILNRSLQRKVTTIAKKEDSDTVLATFDQVLAYPANAANPIIWLEMITFLEDLEELQVKFVTTEIEEARE